MLAAKTQPAKSKSVAPPEKTRDPTGPSAEDQFNPLWGQLALSIRPKLAGGAPDDPHEKQAEQAVDFATQRPAPRVEFQRPKLHAERTLVWDSDPTRLHTTAAMIGGLSEQLGITWPMRILIDDRADRKLGGRSSLGAASGDSVFIRPRGFDPLTITGRRLLAHELTHVAQARIPATAEGKRAHAESEAGAIGETFAAGGRVARPISPLIGSATAHDDDEKAKEDEFLKVPKLYGAKIIDSGILFTPNPPDQKWVGNIDRQLQMSAVYVKGLVGANYSVQLVRDTVAYLKEHGGYVHINIDPGPAAQDETCKQSLLKTPLGNTMIDFFTKVHQPPVPVVLTPALLATIQAQADLQDIYAKLKEEDGILYRWYTETIFTSVMLRNRKVLAQFQAGLVDKEKFNEAQAARTAELVPYEWVLEAVRRDVSLTDDPAYRSLWNLPAKDPQSTDKPAPVDENSRVDNILAAQFLLDNQAQISVEEAAKAQTNAAFRKKVFADWAARMQLKKVDFGGDTTVRDAPSKAVQPPDPSTMFSHPTLESPFYDRQGGSEMIFWMTVYTPNMWEHFIPWNYHWEVIRVPHDDWSKREEVAKDPSAQGEDYGTFGQILGSRFGRNLSNAEADVKRSFFRIENILGPPGMGPTTLALGNAALSPIGSVIKTAFGKFAEKGWEYTAAIKDPGVYVVRCTATRPEDKDVLIHKLPSVAYLPIWVRKPEEITQDRVAVENAMARMNEARLNAIQEKLKNKNLPADERQRLEDEARDIVGVVYGNAETQLNTELRKLEKIKNTPAEWAKLDAPGKESVSKRIDEINFIVGKRAGWVKDLADDSLSAPEKIVAYFIAQEGTSANRPLRLLLEIMKMKASVGNYRFAVLDSSGKDSEHRIGPELPNRADAIAEAVRTLLEDVGYGRGKVTISIPQGVWDVASQKGETRTITIQRSDKQIFFEGLENLALVASIAAIAAAPFTGGESLALLIPIGLIGAVPSAYRLAHRASEGTFEWDMAAAMDILNCIGAVAGLGQFASSVKLIRVSERVWMIVGLGMDGLQGICGGYDLLDKLSKVDPTLPQGARMAEAMMIVGNALLQLGIAIGGRMVAEGQARKAKIEAKSTPEANPNISRASTELHAPLTEAGIKDIPVLRDSSIEGNEVRVHFEKDAYGLPSELYVIAGKGATPEMIRLHVETVQLLQKYSGFSGWVRTLIDRFNALLGSKQFVKPGSRGWNAGAEVNKIRKIIEHYSEEIAAGKISKIDGEAYLDYLKEEVKKHQQALNEVEEGSGFIAAQAPKSAEAVAHGYPEPPPNHYYVEESPGVFQLRAHIGYEGKPKMVVPKKFEKGWEFIERPPETTVADPGTPAAKAAIDDLQQKKADGKKKLEEMKKKAAEREAEQEQKRKEAAAVQAEKDRSIGKVAAEAEKQALDAAKKDPMFDSKRPAVVGEDAVKALLGHAGESGLKMPEFGYWRTDGTFVTVEVKNMNRPDSGHARQKFADVARLANETPAGGSGPRQPKRAYVLEIPDWWSGEFSDPNHKIVNGTLHDLAGPVLIDGVPIEVKIMPFPKP